MSEPTDIASDPESIPQPDVLVLPAEYFFIESIEVPPALTSSEIAEFAELSMESIAPFPLEQLRWGFLLAPDLQRILIYAAVEHRLKRAGHTELESYTWVLPDFASLHGARFNQRTEVILRGEHYDTSFILPGGEALPESIRSLPKGDSPAPHSSGNSSLGGERTAKASGADSHIELRLLPVELNEKGLPVFEFDPLGESPANGHWSPLEPDEATLWKADIRPAEYKTVERNTRRTTARITQAIGYAAFFALLLLLLEGLIFAGQLWLDTREAKVEAQATSVRRIEDKQSLMNKLEQVAQNELRPIAILEAANQVRIRLGNTGIEYDEVVIEDGNRLTVEGKSNTINEFNAYTESLRKSGNFQLVGDPEYVTRSGKTTFTVTLDYIHQQPAPPEPLEEVAPETIPTQEEALLLPGMVTEEGASQE